MRNILNHLNLAAWLRQRASIAETPEQRQRYIERHRECIAELRAAR